MKKATLFEIRVYPNKEKKINLDGFGMFKDYESFFREKDHRDDDF